MSKAEGLPRLSSKELLVLDLLAARKPSYGLELVAESRGHLKRGTVYVTLGRMEDKGYLESEVEEPRPGAASADRADAIDLERALAQLGDNARAVVWLHDVEGYTHEEIAALLGKTASFSKSQLARAYARLRSALELRPGRQSCT